MEHPNSFYEDRITVIPKTDKEVARKENYRPVSLMHLVAKFPSRILANQLAVFKNVYTPLPSGI